MLIYYLPTGTMISAVKAVVLLVSCGAIAHLILSGLSLLPDYRIQGPTFGPKSANFTTESPLKIDLSVSKNITLSAGAGTLEHTKSASNFSFTNTTDFSKNAGRELFMVPQKKGLKQCPAIPPSLVGRIKVWFDKPSFDELHRLYPFLEPGGHGKPKKCLARHRVAVIVPYRDREVHLRILLHNLHAVLTKQQLDYAIFVIEQHENETFNRAKLMNVGYAEAVKLYDWQCFIFHDVDLLPEDDRNVYSCPEQPRHMSVAIDKFQYKLPYGSIFGGISALTKEQFIKINGFSNDYWGWGGEDDDLSTRVTYAGFKIMRYPANIARYKMIKHKAEKQNPLNKCRYDLMAKTQERQMTDGLSSLKYVREELIFEPLFTHIKVQLLETESKTRLRKEGFHKC